MSTPRNTPCVLVIRDGWGLNPNPEHDAFNAVRLADTPVADALMARYPHTLIHTSAEHVGLPDGTMGNSEVGHQNIGAGRIVNQATMRITKACRADGLGQNRVLTEAIGGARAGGRMTHLMGICSDAGVHGLLDHLYALMQLCRDLDQSRVAIHLFMDGRDTGPFSGKTYIEQVEARIQAIGVGVIASVIGRYWAMDRDSRWERVERAYACLTGHRASASGVRSAVSAGEAVAWAYEHPSAETMRGDEFVEPTMIGASPQVIEDARIGDGDCVIYYNYRGDRPRELVGAFVLPAFQDDPELKPSPETGKRGFDRGAQLDLRFVMMTPYSQPLTAHAAVAFDKPPPMPSIMGEHLATLGLGQFRCAETEKFAHVTFFFNDYREEPFAGERREIIPSATVATYDLQPEMSAAGVRDAVLGRLARDECEDFIVVNFANGDMVGHTGNLKAAIRACEVVDACVGTLVEATLARGGCLIVTADHGNAEQMFNPQTNSPHTAHTVYDVPLIVVGGAYEGSSLRSGGRLADIAPTALGMMGLSRPEAMTGRSLIEPA